ncbi:MAG: UDP-glucose--hexose-1-phosphate uridylyltransferase [Bryobacterales bacterium]|nr:UDP-glucose--hexose-1-phosphate uridylyltransferase [Bryobacterales bacterium]
MNLQRPHRRLNPLTGEWILVSPHRMQRPWQGRTEQTAPIATPPYVPDCYLCPGNTRSQGQRNPDFTSTFVFENDFPALLSDADPGVGNEMAAAAPDPVCVAEPERGICRVVCFSPDHSLTLARMSIEALEGVVATWTAQFRELAEVDWIRSVQIFENRGETMGASNPHPHGQIWASESVPNELRKEAARQQQWLAAQGEPLLQQYLQRELASGERLVCANDSFVALVPFWAIWPFETIILPRRHVTGLDQLSGAEPRGLAEILSNLTRRYDRLFETPFPYSMGFHQRPTDGAAHESFTLHAHFYPPLLRSATVRKFMVGFEMLGTPQRDLTPESVAARLRELG